MPRPLPRPEHSLIDILTAALAPPDPNASEEQFDRYHHRDLAGWTVEDLAAELAWARWAARIDATGWWSQRAEVVAYHLVEVAA